MCIVLRVKVRHVIGTSSSERNSINIQNKTHIVVLKKKYDFASSTNFFFKSYCLKYFFYL